MMRWVKRIGYGLLVLLALGAVAYWWFFVETHVAPAGDYAIDLAQVRQLAEAREGDKPTAIRIETVAHLSAPRTIVAAGDGWQPVDLPVSAYELVYPHSSAIIDTGLNADMARAMSATSFDPAAYARVGAAMTRAALIVVTHEHPDHIGGLLAQANVKSLLGVTRLTRAQISELKANLREEPFAALHLPSDLFDAVRPLDDVRYQAVAPGVVLIKAPGHTPGSQMVYVRRADGKEFLFQGDVAWRMPAVETMREKARITGLMAGEDHATVRQELAGLHQLHMAAPEIQMMPGHDEQAIEAWEKAGLAVKGF